MAGICPSCGSLLSDHNRNIRFQLPDPVFEIPEDERADRLWGNDVLMAVKDVGSFVRALLPVHLDDDTSLTFGLWLGVRPDELQLLWEVWWKPEYADVSFTGYLANDLVPWSGSVLGRPVRAEVLDTESVPVVVARDDEAVAEIIRRTWSPDEVLPPFSGLL